MAKKTQKTQKDEQGKNEEAGEYIARRRTELSNNSEHSTYTQLPAPAPGQIGLVQQERGPVGG